MRNIFFSGASPFAWEVNWDAKKGARAEEELYRSPRAEHRVL